MFARFGGTPTVRADAGVHEKWRSQRAEDHWRRREAGAGQVGGFHPVVGQAVTGKTSVSE
jgi:hypothetical protein